ncbi:hypothetical protein MACA111363_02830 [Macrococcoides canis]|uniref:Uncharacterized protein n=1 Tax=Macrococcoides canis TaxID=1855823 RepID=A0A1W7ABT6_9STAP|nr:hypothetical protein [Macrococcus canis]ARQ07075.1 hypothetical protein MCCS_14340 [Macrococcus canis]
MDKKYDVQFRTRDGNAGGGYMTDEKNISEIVEEMKTTINAEVFNIWEYDGKTRILVYNSEVKQMELF